MTSGARAGRSARAPLQVRDPALSVPATQTPAYGPTLPIRPSPRHFPPPPGSSLPSPPARDRDARET
ncbi:hypothetical protein GCM10009859_03140 [Kocuria salsicia]